jgi:peptidoglycan/xylan/chitin deacetylase (PgdA/CDA1 family)
MIALTFDAGASAAPTPKILDVLAKHGVHATFFLTGKWLEKNPELARRIVKEGNEIGNHTYDHKRLTKLAPGDILNEVDKTEQLVQNLTGHSTRPLLRAPYGDRNKRVLSILQKHGYRSIYWDLDSWDSVKAGITSSEIEKRVLGKIRSGSVVLMHCGSQASADALDSLLTHLEAAGYQQAPISEIVRG